MSDLRWLEKTQLEKLLQMGGGYVLDFSNRTFEEFVLESTGRWIYADEYAAQGGSKANRLRAFWKLEANHIVARLVSDLIDQAERLGGADAALVDECRPIVVRLQQAAPVAELDALAELAEGHDFEVVAKAVRDSIDQNEPAMGLDRLHTFVVKYLRRLCSDRGIAAGRDKPLHSIFGEYVKGLRANGEIESEMGERIVKSNISILEAFNHVRNNQSLAHDNALLTYDEALLIFNHVASTVRFLSELEKRRREGEPQQDETFVGDDDIPF